MSRRFRTWQAVAVAGLLIANISPSLVKAQTAPRTVVIGVDHADPANQNPQQARIFEYTDFFTREAAIHTGDTIDFRFSPGSFHIVTLAKSEPQARAAYPLAYIDPDNRRAKGTGFPKLQLGPANGPILNGTIAGGGVVGGSNDVSTCGLPGQKPCMFIGGSDVESSGGVAGFDPQSGNPTPVDWMMQVNAPVGDYDYFCDIHPGMSGRLHVVPGAQPTSAQADIDASSTQQFQADQQLGLQAEQQYNVDNTTTDGGTVTHHVSVGVSAADNHVAIDEMLPQQIHASQGDQVEFKWRDSHNVHTVGFAQDESQLPQPFVFDCGTTFVAPPAGPGGPPGGGFCSEPGESAPELVGDPGNALSGAVLTNPQAIVDSGFLAGTAFGLQPTIQTWSVRTDKHTASGSYPFFCTIHNSMEGTLTIGQ